MSATEAIERFDCFGSTCAVVVDGDAPGIKAGDSARLARRALLRWHESFSRFLPTSELSLLNADPRSEIPVSPMMARFALAVVEAGAMSGGLVDATLIEEIETAGYAAELPHPLPLQMALKLAPQRRRASPAANAGWLEIDVDLLSSVISRPPGLMLDSGGLAKGLFADAIAETLSKHAAFAINCAGDLHVGGTAGLRRPINVESPFDGRTLHTFELAQTGVATSGIGRRSWLDRSGRAAHHLLDPATGEPAFTGIVQVTALAPSALLAEIHAKAAILSGPRLASARLPHGGAIVFDDGSHEVIAPPPRLTLSDLSGFTQPHATSAAHDL